MDSSDLTRSATPKSIVDELRGILNLASRDEARRHRYAADVLAKFLDGSTTREALVALMTYHERLAKVCEGEI